MTQTNIDLTDKQPTALMRLEAVVGELMMYSSTDQYSLALVHVLNAINDLKPSELADLKRSFCEGGIETESAETWAKKWGVNENNLK
jgi:hypothetical protein